jgi:hypothetical protein
VTPPTVESKRDTVRKFCVSSASPLDQLLAGDTDL